MKNFLVQSFRLIFLLLVSFGVIGGVAFYNFQNKKSQKVYAGVGENVTGYAWSENIGWVSFNNTNTGGGTSYGVNIVENAAGVGVFSGYAWSENIGWITFNRDMAMPSGFTPPSNDAGQPYGALAIIDGSNKVQGWARALTACDNNNDGDCSDAGEAGAGTNAGGWDGWIRFNNNSTYGWMLNPIAGVSNFTGWAWGSDVIGWISANNSTGGGATTYKVETTFELNLPPNAPTNFGVTPKYCSSWDSSQTYLRFDWRFSDPNINSGNYQSKYKIDVSYNAGFAPQHSVTNNTSGSSNPQDFNAIVYLSDIKNNLGNWYGQTLYWRVTVWDNGTNLKSTTSSTQNYGPMPSREYPYVNFDSNPSLVTGEIFANQDVQFLDQSTCYSSGDTVGSCQWGGGGSSLWNIPNSTYQSPSTSTTQNPVVQFNQASTSPTTVVLTIRDTAGNECVAQRDISTIGVPLPEIKERK